MAYICKRIRIVYPLQIAAKWKVSNKPPIIILKGISTISVHKGDILLSQKLQQEFNHLIAP